jgi:hypothetical protein
MQNEVIEHIDVRRHALESLARHDVGQAVPERRECPAG